MNEAPVITSNGGGATANVSVAENSAAVTTVVATDVDGPSLAYSIAGGSDAAKIPDRCVDRRTVLHHGAGLRSAERCRPQQQLHRAGPRLRRQPVRRSGHHGHGHERERVPPTVHWTASVDVGSASARLAAVRDRRLQCRRHQRSCLVQRDDRRPRHLEARERPVGRQRRCRAHIRPATSRPASATSITTAPATCSGSIRRHGDVELWKISNGQWAGSVDIGTHPAGYQPARRRRLQRRRHQRRALVQPDHRRGRHLEDLERPVGRQRRHRHASGRLPARARRRLQRRRHQRHRLVQSVDRRRRHLEDRRTASGRAASMSARIRRAGSRSARPTSTATAPATSPGTIRRPTTSTSG